MIFGCLHDMIQIERKFMHGDLEAHVGDLGVQAVVR